MEAGDVDADGLRTDEEPGGDFSVREAFCKEREHVELSGRGLVAIGLPRARRLGGHASPPREIVREGTQRSRTES